MKRILLALLCGLVVVLGYSATVSFFEGFLALPEETALIWFKPLDFPYDIYEMIFGVYDGESIGIEISVLIVITLIYSIPFYFIFRQYSKLKRKSEIKGIETPPEPPIFN